MSEFVHWTDWPFLIVSVLGLKALSLIASDAHLDAVVEGGSYSVIGPGFSIGAGTWVGPHAVI